MQEAKLLILVFAFLVSLFINLGIVLLSNKVRTFITDHLHIGPQTFHQRPTPRLGGLAIFLSLCLALPPLFFKDKSLFPLFALILLSSLPAFLAGIIEDLTKSLSPKKRLAIIFLSGLSFVFLTGFSVSKVDIPYVDYLFTLQVFSLLFTAIALAGLVNAYNIIDGFNGLASMTAVLNLLAIAYVAYKHNDLTLLYVSLLIVSAIIGFFVLNYPYGLIFLGDGGAYLIGFLVGALSILLVERNPQVSPWFALMVNSYPVVETLFSMYRRRFLKKFPTMMPDALHLHTLVYRIYTKKFFKAKKSLFRNPLTSTVMWIINLFALIPAIVLHSSSPMLALCFVLYASFYVFVYFRLLRKKMPLWLKDTTY